MVPCRGRPRRTSGRHPGFVKEASKRGVFAYITDGEGTDWQGSIDIVLRRFAEY
jgi:hypothetical protein